MKVPNELIQEATNEIQRARERFHDCIWWEQACDMSREWASTTKNKTPKRLARENWQYLTYRANAKGTCWGREVYIDTSAREKYLRLITQSN